MTLEELLTISKKDIHTEFDKISAEMETSGYLDHTIRAHEKLVVDMLNNEERAAAKAEKRSIQKKTFQIIKYAKPIKCGQGSIFRHNFGAELFYPQMTKHGGEPDVSRIHTIFGIAHELGHSVLGHLQMNPHSKCIKNKTLESQASYFAKLIVQARSDQYNDDELRAEHTFTPRGIRGVIDSIHDGYDESLIPEK